MAFSRIRTKSGLKVLVIESNGSSTTSTINVVFNVVFHIITQKGTIKIKIKIYISFQYIHKFSRFNLIHSNYTNVKIPGLDHRL